MYDAAVSDTVRLRQPAHYIEERDVVRKKPEVHSVL